MSVDGDISMLRTLIFCSIYQFSHLCWFGHQPKPIKLSTDECSCVSWL